MTNQKTPQILPLRYFRLLEKIYDRMDFHSGSCINGCSECCIRGISTTWIEFEYIVSCLNENEQNAIIKNIENSGNECIFLEDGKCIIYERRPWICRNFRRYPKENKCFTKNTEKGEFMDNFLLSFDITRLNNLAAPPEFQGKQKTIEEWFRYL